MDDREFTALKAHYDAIVPTLATKADVEALRADVYRWMVGSLIGLFIGFAGLFIAMGQILKPTAPQSVQPAQPIVIYLPQPAVPAPPTKQPQQ